LDTFNAQDVSYSIRRLIRGLASPRESSRLGFAVALTEVRLVAHTPTSSADSRYTKLLSRLETVTCGQIMKLVLDASKTQGSMSGQEERDNLFARLFGITSIIHSGLIARNGTLPTSSTSTSSLESYELVVTTLVALGEKKSWLRESAWWALVSAIETLAKSDVEWKEQGVEVTLDTIYAKGSGWTPEKLALTLRLQALFPEKDWGPFLSPVFKNTDILATQNLKVVANILKVCSSDPSNPAAAPFSTGVSSLRGRFRVERSSRSLETSATLRLGHPPRFNVTSGRNASPRGSFQDFWSLVVDGEHSSSGDLLLVSPGCPRIPLFVDVISGDESIGDSNYSKRHCPGFETPKIYLSSSPKISCALG
jgi:hypothetical protein